MDITKRRDRAHYRAWRRGTKEMDLLLGRFADAHADMDDPALTMFEALLDEADGDIYDWLMASSYQGQHQTLIGRIKSFHDMQNGA